mgnify:CR=1 FL=1
MLLVRHQVLAAGSCRRSWVGHIVCMHYALSLSKASTSVFAVDQGCPDAAFCSSLITCACLPQLAFFVTTSLSYQQGILWMGVAIIVVSLSVAAIRFPMWCVRLVRALLGFAAGRACLRLVQTTRSLAVPDPAPFLWFAGAGCWLGPTHVMAACRRSNTTSRWVSHSQAVIAGRQVSASLHG